VALTGSAGIQRDLAALLAAMGPDVRHEVLAANRVLFESMLQGGNLPRLQVNFDLERYPRQGSVDYIVSGSGKAAAHELQVLKKVRDFVARSIVAQTRAISRGKRLTTMGDVVGAWRLGVQKLVDSGGVMILAKGAGAAAVG
jgi:hypothetical protein